MQQQIETTDNEIDRLGYALYGLTDLEDTLFLLSSGAVSGVDPLQALRGRAKQARLTEKLLESRKEDLHLESAKRNR